VRFGKVDANQGQIVDALRAIGVSVQSLASIGKGCPDLIAAKGDKCWVVEVKGEKGRLTPDQEKWIGNWRGTVHIIRTVDEALKLVGVI
jgi:Holliday junction resolvase